MKYTRNRTIKNTILWVCMVCISSITYGKQYIISDDGYFSEQSRALAEQLVHDSQKKEDGPQALYALLQSQIPLVKNVVISYSIPHKVVLQIKGRHPSFVLNNDQVVTEDGNVIPSHYVKRDIVQQLPHINSQKNIDSLSSEMYGCIQSISQDIFAHYQVVLHDPTCIELHDKVEPYFSIITCCSALPDQKILSTCKKLKEKEIAEHKKIKKHEQLVADIRFDKQIIFSIKKGEGQ